MMKTRHQRHDEKRQQTQPWRKLYKTKRWADIRREALRLQPTCGFCRKAPATVIDHVEPHRGDPDKFFHGTLMGLCGPCHNGPKQRIERCTAIPIGVDGWPQQAAPGGECKRPLREGLSGGWATPSLNADIYEETHEATG